MNGTIEFLVIITAIAGTYLAQRSPSPARRVYSLLGGLASVLVAVEAAQQSQFGVCVLFAASALVSLLLAATNYPKPSKSVDG